MKYSALAGNTTGRSIISGRYMESMNDRWLDARIAGPVGGMFSMPTTFGRPIACKNGPMTTREGWYCTRASSALRQGLACDGRPGEGGTQDSVPRPAARETEAAIATAGSTRSG